MSEPLTAERVACPMCGRVPNARLRKTWADIRQKHDAIRQKHDALCACPFDGSDPGCNYLVALDAKCVQIGGEASDTDHRLRAPIERLRAVYADPTAYPDVLDAAIRAVLNAAS